jgi:EAL domain-containing protein (putative c-di-GMP-specific phosphodiesterase class I)
MTLSDRAMAGRGIQPEIHHCMRQVVIKENEEARLNALRNLGLLDTPPSESFDRITRMASRLLNAPVSTISLTDRDRQWFKARFGTELAEIPRAQAPCSYAIRSNEIFIVPDMLDDERFDTSPLATAGIRFYAGAPLITRSGYGLGTLAVIDVKPRQLNDDEQLLLRDLAGMVMTQIEVQNSIGRVDPTSGHANEYQLLEDLEDLAIHSPGETRTGLLIELVASKLVEQGMRVLGASYVEDLVRNSIELIRCAMDEHSRLYHVGPTRCVILCDAAAGRGWHDIAADLAESLRQPIQCGGIPALPNPVIGIHEFRTDEVAPRDVLRRLFSATNDARETGKVIASYNVLHDQAHARSFQLLHDIREALAQPDELSLVYQPRLDFVSGRCIGAEALLRWQHPRFGNVPPGEFIPLVEQTALARPVTEWVLNAAIGQTARWRRAGYRQKISINVSALNLEEEDFADRLGTLLAQHDVPPAAIELEFTESALARDNARVVSQLNALKRTGIDIAIDDFGTGYSSLSYLQQIPANILKIDRSFVRSLTTSEHDQKLVRAMIAMAHDLGYRVVAEGIETKDAYDLLASWKCDEAQGYYIARPLLLPDMQGWLSKPA